MPCGLHRTVLARHSVIDGFVVAKIREADGLLPEGMADVTTYQGNVRWSTAAHAFVVDLHEAGGTQATRRDEADAVARVYLSLMTDEPEDSIAVELIDDYPPAVAALIDQVESRTRRIRSEQEALAAANRRLARELVSSGMTGRQAASTMRVSPQRVSQLLSEPDRTPVAEVLREWVPAADVEAGPLGDARLSAGGTNGP